MYTSQGTQKLVQLERPLSIEIITIIACIGSCASVKKTDLKFIF